MKTIYGDRITRILSITDNVAQCVIPGEGIAFVHVTKIIGLDR